MDDGIKFRGMERAQPQIRPRSWSPDHEKMGKGVTLTAEELSALKTLLNGMQL